MHPKYLWIKLYSSLDLLLNNALGVQNSMRRNKITHRLIFVEAERRLLMSSLYLSLYCCMLLNCHNKNALKLFLDKQTKETKQKKKSNHCLLICIPKNHPMGSSCS